MAQGEAPMCSMLSPRGPPLSSPSVTSMRCSPIVTFVRRTRPSSEPWQPWMAVNVWMALPLDPFTNRR